MKVSKGAFDVNCSTTKDPSIVINDMYRALELHQV